MRNPSERVASTREAIAKSLSEPEHYYAVVNGDHVPSLGCAHLRLEGAEYLLLCEDVGDCQDWLCYVAAVSGESRLDLKVELLSLDQAFAIARRPPLPISGGSNVKGVCLVRGRPGAYMYKLLAL